MADKTTKILLGAIALGLWLNAVLPLFKPSVSSAQADWPYLTSIDKSLNSLDRHLSRIDTAVEKVQAIADAVEKVQAIADGTCPNKQICPSK